MNVSMTVFSVDDTTVPAQAFLADGSPVNAAVPGKRVQLVSEAHGSWTLNLTGADADAWSATPNSAVLITIG